MKKISLFLFTTTAILFSNCASTDDTNGKDEPQEVISKPFTEGTLEMGIYSHTVDLGKLIDKIDFSQPNAKEQYENLVNNDPETQEIVEVISQISNQNPMVAWAVTLNMAECTYFIKQEEVLGKVRGLGWTMDNYYNKPLDQASIYLETLTQIEQIAMQDRTIYSSFSPAQNDNSGAINGIDFSEFHREILNEKQNILGYLCDVIVYTPKNIDESAPMSLRKMKVYTSPLMNNVINFAHPFYLDETNGILRLDAYYLDDEQPTLVMKPKQIKATQLTAEQMKTRLTTSVYSQEDINWGFKALAIIMSGWGVLQN